MLLQDWRVKNFSRFSSVGFLTGLVGLAFLSGVAAHSVLPSETISISTISWITIFATALIVIGWKKPPARALGLLILAAMLGVWRFEMARPSMPRGLIFGSPRGLAYVSSDVRVSDETDPRYWLGNARRTLTNRVRERFTADEASLLTGILYGERGLSKTLKENFRRAGLLHLVAVSGSNVTIIAVVVMHLFLLFGLSRRASFIALASALATFVLFVSPSASVVRAAIMGLLVEFAPLVGRIPRPSRLLLISAVVFVMWKPWTLFFDPSFALSFLAMWGLLTWGTWIDQRLARRFRHDELRAILAATIGATLMTIPYTAWAFEQVSLWGLLTSLIALPLVPWVMAAGLLALLLPSLPIMALPAQGFLQIILWSARWPEFFSASTSSASISWQMMAAVYVFLFFMWRLVHRRKLIHISQTRKMIATPFVTDVSEE